MGLRSYLDSIEHHFEKGGKHEKWYALYEAVDTALYRPSSVTRTTAHVRDDDSRSGLRLGTDRLCRGDASTRRAGLGGRREPTGSPGTDPACSVR